MQGWDCLHTPILTLKPSARSPLLVRMFLGGNSSGRAQPTISPRLLRPMCGIAHGYRTSKRAPSCHMTNSWKRAWSVNCCVCAEKMTDDYVGPKRREARLRNRAVRRTRWLQRTWRRSAKGNSFLNLEGYNLVVYPTKTGRWGYKIGDRFGPRTYPTVAEAKLALFDDFWVATQNDVRLWGGD